MRNFNRQAIEYFGSNNMSMDIESSNRHLDGGVGSLMTRLEVNFVRASLQRLDVSRRDGTQILDLGAGKGRMSRHLVTMCQRCVAVEPFGPFCESIRRWAPPALEVRNCSLKSFAESETCRFDLIYLAGVTNQLDDDELDEALVSIRKLLHPAGLVLIKDFGICDSLACPGPYGSRVLPAKKTVQRPARGIRQAALNAGLETLLGDGPFLQNVSSSGLSAFPSGFRPSS